MWRSAQTASVPRSEGFLSILLNCRHAEVVSDEAQRQASGSEIEERLRLGTRVSAAVGVVKAMPLPSTLVGSEFVYPTQA